jgi:hypothetical protein
MAEEPKNVCEWLDIHLDTFTGEGKLNLIAEIYEYLTAIQLRQIRGLANQKRIEKLEEAKQQVIAEMREKFEQLDLDFDEGMLHNGFVIWKKMGKQRRLSDKR